MKKTVIFYCYCELSFDLVDSLKGRGDHTVRTTALGQTAPLKQT